LHQTIIAEIKRAVLEGCKIVFTGVIPLGERQQEADIWKIAEEFGAKCLLSVSSAVTHLIAAKPGTEKVRQAYKLGHVHVVYPGWLYNSVATWNREQEEHYALPREERHGSKPAEPSPAFPELHLFGDNSSEPDSDNQQEQVEELEENLEAEDEVAMSAMDWGEAADEVDAYLDSEDDEDETTDGRASQTSRR
jgi:RNA polymerase II subunit A C-terminal domain phosphatase